MTGLALNIKLRCLCALVFMGIVTADAGDLAILKTFAGSEHSVLVAVYIDSGNGFCGIGLKEVEQLISRLKGKRWF